MATRPINRPLPRGASMLEMALLVALIAVIMIGSVTTFGTSLKGKLDEVNEGLAGMGQAPRCPPTCW